MQYFMGGVAAWMTVPLLVAGLVVLLKRFRSRGRFIQVSQFFLWALFAVSVFGVYGLSSYGYRTDGIGDLFLRGLVASVLLLLIAYLDKVFLWLKREVV